MTNIGEIVEKALYINQSVKGKEIDKFFTEHPKLQGIVVVHNEKPIGHITRTYFYQKIGTLYGYDLYMGRESKLLAKKSPLVVDCNEPITKVSKQAMERIEEDLYDDVIVTTKGKFIGTVSIKSLLTKLVETQVELASFLNPLSKLPGNELINRNLEDMIHRECYSLLYFDLDHFKTFNDLYGFQQGDKVLLHITEILKKYVDKQGHFLGHIGGDDFMAILPHYEVKELCEKIIHEFDASIPLFYQTKHLNDEELLVTNRQGQLERLSIVSLSIAIVTNQIQSFADEEEVSNSIATVKRNCKQVKGSCYLVNAFEVEEARRCR